MFVRSNYESLTNDVSLSDSISLWKTDPEIGTQGPTRGSRSISGRLERDSVGKPKEISHVDFRHVSPDYTRIR